MGGSDRSDTKQRVIPRLKEVEKEDHDKELEFVDLGGKESEKERIKRIQDTNVSFTDFLKLCVDVETLKLFIGILLLIFIGTFIASILYIGFVYKFDAKTWTFYFPTHPYVKTEL